MQVPLEIIYRDVEKTDAIESLVREKAAKLEQICDYIISCRIAIERPHKHKQSGKPFRVRIDLTVPHDHVLIVERLSANGNRQEPLQAAIRNAFEAMRRQLQEVVEKQRGEIKAHPEQQVMALVEKILRDEGYGFLRTIEGQPVYFHAHSVLHGEFERLEVGTGVRFAAEMGEKGLQATSVEIVNKPGSNVGEGRPRSP